ncbi:MAG: SDR family oxidoreductase [Candidatus Thermoplasmatota archaeon]|nr:SDR family oxidoreductase [Candidatus Thermoplasmatota archaeon]
MYSFHLSSHLYFVSTQDDVDRAVSEAVKTFGKKDIMVNNAVCPGGITTGMTQDLFKDPQLITGMVPMGEIGKPEDIAKGMLYLASDDSRYVTGTLLTIDGGWRAK